MSTSLPPLPPPDTAEGANTGNEGAVASNEGAVAEGVSGNRFHTARAAQPHLARSSENDSSSLAASSVAPSSAASASSTKKGGLFRWLLRLGMGGVLLAWLIQKHGASLGQALHAVTPLVLLASATAYLLGQVVSAWKWRALLGALDAPTSLWTCCRFYWLGMFWNLWMPTSIGGDALRIYLIQRHAPALGTGRATASVVIERLTGLTALLLIGAVALPLDSGSSISGSAQARRIFWIAGFGFALLGLLAVWALRGGRVPGPMRPLLGKVQNALTAFRGDAGRHALLRAVVLSFVFQGSQVALNYGLARAVGLPLSLLTVAWVTPALALASLLPIGIGGLGVREAAALALLAGGVASSDAGLLPGAVVAWSLLWQVTVWLSSAPGGLWALKGTTK